MIIDRRSLMMSYDNFSFSSLTADLYKENALSDLEMRCFITNAHVGDDLYDEYIDKYPGECSREKSELFIIQNSDFVDY